MEVDGLKIIKLKDSLYNTEIPKTDREAMYCEIQYQRDRSSFAGMAFNITGQKGVITVEECDEKIVMNISKYENLYQGCEHDYVDSIKDIFMLGKKNYGLEILYLLYSDVRSCCIIFEDLMKKLDENIDIIREIFT